MKNKFLPRIMAIFVCVLVLFCMVVPAGALPYNRDDLTYYQFRTNASYFERGDFAIDIKIESPTVMRAIFDYAYLNNQKYSQDVYFNTLDVRIESGIDDDTELFYTYVSFDFNDVDTVFYIRKDEEQNEFFTYLDGQVFNNNLPDNILFSLQLIINLNTITEINIERADENTTFNDILNSTYYLVKKQEAKTYSQGYNNGLDFGLEEGYNNGYDQGSIDGIQQGLTEGYDNGYAVGVQDGFDEGYFSGFDDGRSDGLEDGYRDGYADAKAVYDTTEAWQDMKSLIFAIFDAPFYVISYSLDFNLFGINVAGTLIALISTALIVWLLKIIIVKFF